MATLDPIQNGVSSDNPAAEPSSTPAEDPTPDPAAAEKRWPGWPGHCVFRLIVPVLKVGSIIGRKGELIKKTCEETKARIRVLDGAVGTSDRIVSLPYFISRVSSSNFFYFFASLSKVGTFFSYCLGVYKFDSLCSPFRFSQLNALLFLVSNIQFH